MAGLELPADSYKSVLYLTAGGDAWLTPYQDLPIPWPQEAKKGDPANGLTNEMQVSNSDIQTFNISEKDDRIMDLTVL